MPDEEDEGSAYSGLEEAATEFERLTRVKLMDDATLLYHHRVLSDARIVRRSAWLELIETEVRARGLLRPN